MTSTGPLTHAPWTGRAWRDTTFVAAGVPVQLAAFVVLVFPWTVWVPVSTTQILLALAIPVALILAGARALTSAQRRRFWALLGVDVPRVPTAGNRLTWRGVTVSVRSETTWRQVGYHLVAGPILAAGGALTILIWAAGFALASVFVYGWALPISLRPAGWTTRDAFLTVAGILLLLAAPWVAAGVTRLDSRVAAALLGPNRAKELQRRVEDLTESRAGVVDAADAERRRIERDLHDGAQQRLVSLALNLGLARETLTGVPDDAMRVIVEAHEEAKEALTELRNLVRGLHPAVLDARGLDAALSGVAARAPLPVRLRVEVPERVSPTVEAVAYFVASEALTNASRARPRVSHLDHRGAARRRAADRPVRRRGGRRGPERGNRPGRPRAARPFGGRYVPDRQPSGGTDHHHRGVAVRIVIAEDSVLLRAGLIKLLETAGYEVVAAVGDATGLLTAVEEHQPDAVIVDVRMPPAFTDEGVRAALVIRRQWPGIGVLVLSQYVEERYAAELLSANTSGVGYLLKDRVADVSAFLDALSRVIGGGTALDPEVVSQLLLRRRSDPLDRLTPRERDVLALMAEGRSNAGIAEKLVVGDSAVAKHINNIFAKLDLSAADADHRRVLAVLRFLSVG